MEPPSSSITDKEILDHAWKYFTIHAQQRLLLFNVFMVSSGAIVAGLAACFQKSGLFTVLGAVLGGILTLNSFVFWKLDQRSAFLVKHAEDALIEFENTFPNPTTRLVYREPLKTASREQGFFATRMWTYGSVFRFVFVTMAIVGLAGGGLSAAKYLGWLE
jgi:hypothetical protein